MPVAALESMLERRWHGAAVHGYALPLTGWTTGIPSLDQALGPTGIPHGRLTEIFGTASSGKTTLAFALLAACTRRGDIGAYVDPENNLFAPAAEAAGIDLDRLIVVRPKAEQAVRRAADAIVRSGACAVVVLDGTSADVLQTHHYARLVSQAERNGITLVVLSRGESQPLASFASLRVRMRELSSQWQPGSNGGGRLSGYSIVLDVAKSRMGAPGKSAAFDAYLPDITRSWPIAGRHEVDRSMSDTNESQEEEHAVRCATIA
jgi:hypothetical protein